MRAKLPQLRANKSPLSQIYLHTVNPKIYTPQCPLCLSHTDGTNHLFNCSQPPTQHNTIKSVEKSFRSRVTRRPVFSSDFECPDFLSNVPFFNHFVRFSRGFVKTVLT